MRYLPVAALILFALSSSALGETFVLPSNGDNVVGEVREIAANYEDTFTALARTHHLGYLEMRRANPEVDPWLPGTGTTIRLPSFYILPDAPREGIVINLAEMRLYYYPPAEPGQPRLVETHPIGIGREAFPTPEFSTQVKARIPNPAWYPPESIIAEYAARGVSLPRTVPPGPDNPMGDHAIQLGVPGYFIHGTNRAGGIGLRVSHGCIRMYPEDIADLFNKISLGTPVRVLHQPVKVGIRENRVFVESHPETASVDDSFEWQITSQLTRILGERSLEMNWEEVERAAEARSGVPTAIAQLDTPEGEVVTR